MARRLCLYLCLGALLAGPARGETLAQGIAAIKQTVVRGDVGAFYRRVAVASIVAAEVDRAVLPKSAGLTARAARRAVRTAAGAYLAWEIRRQLHSSPAARRSAVDSFRINKLTQTGRRAVVSASYSVPGAAETVGLALAQDRRDDWVVVGVNSGLLRRTVKRLALR